MVFIDHNNLINKSQELNSRIMHMPHSSLHPLLAHHHLCYVDVYCVFLFFLFFYYFCFLQYATFLCDSILACCLCTYFLFRFYFCVIPRFFFNWLADVFLISFCYRLLLIASLFMQCVTLLVWLIKVVQKLFVVKYIMALKFVNKNVW